MRAPKLHPYNPQGGEPLVYLGNALRAVSLRRQRPPRATGSPPPPRQRAAAGGRRQPAAAGRLTRRSCLLRGERQQALQVRKVTGMVHASQDG